MKRPLLCVAVILIASLTALPAQQTTPTKLLIAFASYKDRPKYPDIFFYEHDGIATGKIVGTVATPRSANASGKPVWTQDGRYCFFTFEVENKTSKINCWDRKEAKFVELGPAIDSPNAILGASISSDGNLIAFAGWNRPGGPGTGYHVFLLDKSAKKLVDLPGLNSQSFDDRMPALSGDGRFLAFTSNRKGGVGLTDLYLYDRKESKLLNVPELNTKYSELEPALNTDGGLIACASERPGGAGGRDIFLFDRSAGKYLSLPGLNTPSHELSPSLSPDGRFIAFVSERVDGAGDRDIYLYDRAAQKLLPTPGLNSKTEDFDPCVMVLANPQ